MRGLFAVKYQCRIDLAGLISNIKQQFIRDQGYNLGCFNLDQLEGHIRLLASEYEKGNYDAVYQFLDLYNFKIKPPVHSHDDFKNALMKTCEALCVISKPLSLEYPENVIDVFTRFLNTARRERLRRKCKDCGDEFDPDSPEDERCKTCTDIRFRAITHNAE